ncbi:MAG: hypothetical protein RBS48_04940 [Ignavibacteriaceae bacterium]|jgi:hypothetical protein|nr:hypothetical protein [Ignavibacteriaceae bacterium]
MALLILKIIGNYLEVEMESLNDFLNLVVYAILFFGGLLVVGIIALFGLAFVMSKIADAEEEL